MPLKALLPIVRTIGLIALFWTSWPIALASFLALSVTNKSDFKGRLVIRNTKLRIAVEILTAILAIVGVWFFPLIKPITANIIAVVFAVLSFVSLIGPLAGLDYCATPSRLTIREVRCRNIYRRESGETYTRLDEQFHVKVEVDDAGVRRLKGRAEKFDPNEKVTIT
jgi:hypothetical protein